VGVSSQVILGAAEGKRAGMVYSALSLGAASGMPTGCVAAQRTVWCVDTASFATYAAKGGVLPKVKDIVDTAVAAGAFKTLAAALTACGLVSTLKGKGPFTVFAPTDAAFAKLPPGTVDALLQDIPKLTSILTYHVVPGEVKAAAVLKAIAGSPFAQTVNGKQLRFRLGANGGAMVDGATVTAADVLCNNGVIHVVDSVMLPPLPGVFLKM
jgi:uncharacterized surface protein with fasciclin (FAS1) repeats